MLNDCSFCVKHRLKIKTADSNGPVPGQHGDYKRYSINKPNLSLGKQKLKLHFPFTACNQLQLITFNFSQLIFRITLNLVQLLVKHIDNMLIFNFGQICCKVRAIQHMLVGWGVQDSTVTCAE